MSLEVFREALEMGDEFVTLGGGEPTMHPLFEQFLLEAIAKVGAYGLLVITNGKNERRGRMLMELGAKKVCSVELSQDDYHEPIDPEFVDEWKTKLGPRSIRNTTDGREPVGVGRAVTELDIEPSTYCMCDDLIIKPNGDLKLCGCEDSPIVGDVFGGIQVECQAGECYRHQELVEA
jgi:hypothetical protein